MFRTLRLLAILILPTLFLGIPFGLMLGNFAAGEAPASRVAGYQPPDAGAETRSASAADSLQPADVAYVPEDRYVQAAVQRWAD